MKQQKLLPALVLSFLLVSVLAFERQTELEGSVNPGAYAFGSSSLIPRIIHKYFPMLQQIISQRIDIPNELKTDVIELKQVWVQ